MTLSLTFVHLYPTILNLYGDRGNVIALRQRCLWRGIGFNVVALGLGDPYDGCGDLLFIGGDQDREQAIVAKDLRKVKGEAIRDAVERGVPLLAVCGGYQLLQRYYRPAEGPELEGLGIFDAYTVHRGSKVPRCIGNIAVEWERGTLVGFENHGGRTYLGLSAQPLGRVLAGFGNNGEDGSEGAIYRHAYGTYMHGSLLPKNPAFTDHLIELALRRQRSDPSFTLPPLDDRLEQRAHSAALAKTFAEKRRYTPRAKSLYSWTKTGDLQ
jgi:CobQ-like glutamine amidotransferase family enzyme